LGYFLSSPIWKKSFEQRGKTTRDYGAEGENYDDASRKIKEINQDGN
jgi:hypothetical protein